MWIVSSGTIFFENMARFEAGKLVFVRAIERLHDPVAVTECRYSAGALVESKSSRATPECPKVSDMEDFLTPPRRR